MERKKARLTEPVLNSWSEKRKQFTSDLENRTAEFISPPLHFLPLSSQGVHV